MSEKSDQYPVLLTVIVQVRQTASDCGSFDYLLTIRIMDMSHFRKVLGDKVNGLPVFLQTNSFAVMEVIKESHDFAVLFRQGEYCELKFEEIHLI